MKCLKCSKYFKKSRYRVKYCSYGCYWESRKVYKACNYCKKVFWAKRPTRKTCSAKCKHKRHSQIMKGHKCFNGDINGNKNPNWKGGRILDKRGSSSQECKYTR